METPIWLRIVLLVACSASFIPQIYRLWKQRNSSGISLYYILCNLLVATELFTISFLIVINDRVERRQDPPGIGESINLMQLSLVLFAWLLISGACFDYPSDSRHPNSRTIVALTYFCFILIAVVPVFLDALIIDPHEPDHKWILAWLGTAHIFIVNPAVCIVGIAALFFQIKEILARPPASGSGALSLVGLAVQAVVFTLVAILWPGRVMNPSMLADSTWPRWIEWTETFGLVVIDNAIFAVTQTILLGVSLWHQRRKPTTADELEPLLRG